MANLIISENYNPNRKAKYQWQIRSDQNDISKIKRMFKAHDAADPCVLSTEAWGWDSERQCYSTELGEFDWIAQTVVEYLDLSDEYESMRKSRSDRDAFDDLIGNQMYQYANMIRFTAEWNNGIDVCKGVIRSDGSHDVHGVSLFDEEKFMQPYSS